MFYLFFVFVFWYFAQFLEYHVFIFCILCLQTQITPNVYFWVCLCVCAVLNSDSNILLNISWIFSLISLASRIVSDDYNFVTSKYRNLDFKCDKCPCINLFYTERVLFRWMDVIGRIGILSLSWVAVNGYCTAILIVLDAIVAIILPWMTDELFYNSVFLVFCWFCNFLKLKFCIWIGGVSNL